MCLTSRSDRSEILGFCWASVENKHAEPASVRQARNHGKSKITKTHTKRVQMVPNDWKEQTNK